MTPQTTELAERILDEFTKLHSCQWKAYLTRELSALTKERDELLKDKARLDLAILYPHKADSP